MTGVMEQTLAVTFFKSFAATSKSEETLTLDALAEKIRVTTAPNKAALPWMKLAQFGGVRTDKNSLRHDANVLAITGIEVDYDGEKIPVDDAIESLTKAGLLSIVYTSPSHSPEKPRWRALCPTSKELPPDKRKHLVGRINGIFDGALANESWTLSQSYYLGSVNHNPAHCVKIIEGDHIDELDELDEIWRGPPDTKQSTGQRIGPLDENALIQAIIDGKSYHEAAVRLLGRWARTGVSYMAARRRLTDAMETVFPADRDARWTARMADVDRCLEDIYAKEARKRDGQSGDAGAEGDPARASAADDARTAIGAVVAEFNAKYMLVMEVGKAVILQPGFDPVLKRRRYDRLTTRDLQTLYMNRLVKVGENDKGAAILKSAANVWLHHCGRRQFINGVTFDPTHVGSKDGVLNLWEGYAVKPKPGDWSLMRAHIEDLICDQDSVRFGYLMGWMARMLQHPAEQGEVAVVMRSVEGAGKGTLAKALMHIVGHHGMAISNGKHLVGNFNAHLRDVIFLFADEALFAGDRSHVGALKSLITEPYLTVEAKHANAVQAPNFLHVMMASNEEWVIPASLEARRFFVLDVPDTHRGDHEYFGAIWRQMAAGGYEAMLHDLLNYDLTDFNARSVPTTAGLQNQRKLSLGVTESWWLDCLERGYVFKSRLGLEADFAQWQAKISTELLFASYMEFAKSRSERRPLSREGLGRFFVDLNATPLRWRNGAVGEAMTDDLDAFGRSIRKAKVVRQQRTCGYAIGTLDQARADFARITKLSIEWDGGAPDMPDEMAT